MSKQGYITYITVMAFSFFISVAYNACSEDVNFDTDPNREGSLFGEPTPPPAPKPEPKPTILINNDAKFTNDAQVNLSLDAGIPATEMFISNEPGCTDGQWESYQTQKPWTLGKANTAVKVYAKYRGEETTECVEDVIVHDDIAPVVNISTTTQSGWITSTALNVQFNATDNLTGVKDLECKRSETDQFKACSGLIAYLNLKEGENYEIIIQATDHAGNKSDLGQLDWQVDITPPTVAFNLTPAQRTADITPDFQFTATDLGVGVQLVECKVDNAATWTACTDQQTLMGLADGPHTFSVRATDRLGHVSDVISYDWVQDSTAPTIMFVSTPDAITSDPMANFEFQGLDGGNPITAFQCSLDGAAMASCSSPHVINNLGDGVHNFSVIGQDSVGNMSAPISYGWLVDTSKPTIAFVQTPPAVTNDTDADFQVNANDTGSGIDKIECRLDNGAYQDCDAMFSFNGLADGNHTAYARATDKAGNVSDEVSYTWLVDTVKPTVTITSGPNNPINTIDANFTFVANDAGSGIAFIECRVDGMAFELCTSPKAYEMLAEGLHNFYVRATDNAGNQSDTETYEWLIDTQPPVVSFETKPDPNIFVDDNAVIKFNVVDNGSGVDSYNCLLDGVAINCMEGTDIPVPSDAIDSHTFSVQAIDNVGNVSLIETTYTVTLNTIAKATDFNVKGDQPVDVLFMIDNSGSMDEEHANLATRIAGFIDKINALDWQLGIVTTDVKSPSNSRPWRDGKFVKIVGLNDTYVLNAAMGAGAAQTYFEDTVMSIGVNGSGDEQGIHGTKRAIQRALDSSNSAENQPNRDFFREGAQLAVVVLSDEDEASQGNDGNVKTQPQDLLDFINQSFNGQKNLTWHSIIVIPGDNACLNNDPRHAHYYGDKYYELSQLTGLGQPGGAIVGSVCENDYTNQLADIGESVRDMQKTITLECEPVDADQNGLLDISVEAQLAGQSAYSAYNGGYQVQGAKLVFDNFLPPGDYKINYTCKQ